MSDIDWEHFFKPEDFNVVFHAADCDFNIPGNLMSEQANQKLWAIIQCQEKLRGSLGSGEYHGVPVAWFCRSCPTDTHEARIIDVRKLK